MSRIVGLIFAIATSGGPVEEVSGYGRSVEDARIDARQHALQKLKERLAGHEPPLTAWEPTLHDIESLIADSGRAGKTHFVEPLGRQDEWILPVRFPTDAEMVRRDLQNQRGKAMVWVLAAASIALAGAALWRRSRAVSGG